MYYLAQANYAQWKATISQPLIDDFMSQIELVHQVAECSKGYVWRYVDDPDPAVAEQVFGVNRMVFNMSVWKTIDDLREFTFKSHHSDVMKKRAQWFAPLPNASSVLWWIKENHRPSVQEAKRKFDLLNDNGPTIAAFTFRDQFVEPD